MLNTKPNSAWAGLPGEQKQRRVVLQKPRTPVAVYNLPNRKSGKFFGYIGKITLLCFFGALVYGGIEWGLHRYHATVTVVEPEPPSADDSAFAAVPPAAVAQGPQIDYVKSWGITKNSASVSWSTNTLGTTQVDYGTTPKLGLTTPLVKTLSPTHGALLTGLMPATTYYFRPKSVDANGVASKATTYTFATSGLVGVGPGPAITDVVVEPAFNHKLKISWKTSVPAFSYVQLGTTTTYDRWSTRTDLTGNPHPDFSWVPSGLIHYQLISTDASGNRSSSPDRTFTEP